MHAVAVFAFELPVCCGGGRGAGEDHVVPGAKAVPITGRQVNGLAVPVHGVPLPPDGVTEEVTVKSVRNSSVY